MIIDKSHLALAMLTGLLCVLALAAYLWGASRPGPYSAGSAVGLLLGVAGSACMVLAGLLPARKKAAKRRGKPVQAWLRGHIWFGLLSGPLILLHAGFRWGGRLEQALMIVFALVYVSGVVGVALQHYLPRVMTTLAPRQAIFDQLSVNCERLVHHADRLVTAKCGSLLEWLAGGVETPAYGAEQMKQFYCERVRPFLGFERQRAKVARLDNSHAAQQLFEEQQLATPTEYHELLDQLALICGERRDMRLQQRLHWWLHGWLILHVPLSSALLVLGVAHAVMSLRFLY